MTIEKRITNELLDALAVEIERTRRRPGGVTTSELARKTGRSRGSCRDFLERKVKAGELVRQEFGAMIVYYEAGK